MTRRNLLLLAFFFAQPLSALAQTFPTGWSGYAVHSVTTEPGANLTDFTFLVSLNQMPSEWWTAVQTDGDDIRASKDSAGATRLPVDIIEFTDSGTSGTGLIAVKYSGTKSSSSDEPIYIWVGNGSATRPADSDTYGADNAYASHIRAFYPSGGGDDRTSFVNHLTMTGSPTVGGAAGPINGSTATDYNGSSQRGTATASVPTDEPISYLVHGNSDSDAVDQAPVLTGDNDANQHISHLWRGDIASDPVQAFARNTGLADSASIIGYTTATWYATAAVISTDSSRVAYLNGTAGTESTVTITTPTDLDHINVGGRFVNSSSTSWFDGRLSLVVISTAALSGDWISYWKEMLDDADQSDFFGTWSWTAAAGNTTAIKVQLLTQ